MFRIHTFAVAAIAALLSGCAPLPVQYGDKATEATLKRQEPVAGKLGLYVCRSASRYLGPRSTIYVDDTPLTAVANDMFAHVLLEPGTHRVHLVNRASRGNLPRQTGALVVEGGADEIRYVWIGFTAGPFPVFTFDLFDSAEQGRACVNAAALAGRLVD